MEGEMSRRKAGTEGSRSDPVSTYHDLKGDLTRVLSLPLKGRRDLFRDVLVGYLIVEHDYTEEKAKRLVEGNEEMILLMLTEEEAGGFW
jgi:hypothetical protein